MRMYENDKNSPPDKKCITQNHSSCGNGGLALSYPGTGEVEDLLLICIISGWIQREGGNEETRVTQEENSSSLLPAEEFGQCQRFLLPLLCAIMLFQNDPMNFYDE